jgi:hypothetical protein
MGETGRCAAISIIYTHTRVAAQETGTQEAYGLLTFQLKGHAHFSSHNLKSIHISVHRIQKDMHISVHISVHILVHISVLIVASSRLRNDEWPQLSSTTPEPVEHS